MNFYPVSKGLIPLALLGMSSCAAPQQEARPNFVIILFDDLGWDDLGVHGNNLIETPNLDAFAAESAQLSSFYVNPVCAASRASLLTGRHFLRTGVSHVHGGKDFLSLKEITLADVLQQNGYKTTIWGKWHTGDAEKYYPWQRGFDEALKLRLYQHRNAYGVFNGQPVDSDLWADEFIVDHAIDFIGRNQSEPFFAFVSLLAPHTPLDAPEDIIQKYEQKGLSRNLATLYAMVDLSDRELGRLFSAMDSLNLDENTVVMILSDNGPAVNRAEMSDDDRAIRYVNDLRGHKGDIWENGVKSPLFIRWPGVIEPQTIEALTDITDIFPTLLDWADIDYLPALPIDGKSITSFFEGKTEFSGRLTYNYSNRGWPPSLKPYNPDGNYNEYQPVDKSELITEDQVISIRNQRYKLMLNPSVDGDFDVPGYQYFLADIENDPTELVNLVDSLPELFDTLRDSLFAWYSEVLNEPNSYASPVLYLVDNEPNQLKATWVSDLSDGLLNTVTSVKKWSSDMAWVEYRIVSPVAARYEIRALFKADKPLYPLGIISLKDKIYSSELLFDEKQWKTIADLPEGQSTIRFTVIPDSAGVNIDELVGFEFTKR